MQDKKIVINPKGALSNEKASTTNTLSKDFSLNNISITSENIDYTWSAGENFLSNNNEATLENSKLNKGLEEIYLDGQVTQYSAWNATLSAQEEAIKELLAYPLTNNIDFSIDNTFISISSNLKAKANIVTKNIKDDVETFSSLSYEETRGGDFLESAVEEQLPYLLDKSPSGDVYKILKNSLSDNKVEIWDYKFGNDKIDLADFMRDYGDSFNYSITKENHDISLNLHSSNSQFSIVFKEAELENTDLDMVIKNIIVESNKS